MFSYDDASKGFSSSLFKRLFNMKRQGLFELNFQFAFCDDASKGFSNSIFKMFFKLKLQINYKFKNQKQNYKKDHLNF